LSIATNVSAVRSCRPHRRHVVVSIVRHNCSRACAIEPVSLRHDRFGLKHAAHGSNRLLRSIPREIAPHPPLTSSVYLESPKKRSLADGVQ
jgi:hypothetical protein